MRAGNTPVRDEVGAGKKKKSHEFPGGLEDE
jgi:hypothetical protein